MENLCFERSGNRSTCASFPDFDLKQSSSGAAITAGTIGLGDLGTGSPSSSTYLRGDGTWAAGTNTTAAGSTTQVQYNNAGTLAGSSKMTFDGNGVSLTLGAIGTPGLKVTGIASQTADYTQWIDSSANKKAYVNSSGAFASAAGFSLDELTYPVNGGNLGGINARNNTTGTPTTSLYNILGFASENHDATHQGTDLRFATTVNAAATPTARLWIRNNGDIELNGIESALSTSATGGFVYIPNMAGMPTGTPTSRTGNTPAGYDTANKIVWAHNGSAWQPVGSNVTVTNNSTGTVTYTQAQLTIYLLANGGSARTVTIPDATKWQGGRVTVKWTVAAAGVTTTINATSGNIEGSASYAFTGVGSAPYPCVTLESDGTNWYIVSKV